MAHICFLVIIFIPLPSWAGPGSAHTCCLVWAFRPPKEAYRAHAFTNHLSTRSMFKFGAKMSSNQPTLSSIHLLLPVGGRENRILFIQIHLQHIFAQTRTPNPLFPCLMIMFPHDNRDVKSLYVHHRITLPYFVVLPCHTHLGYFVCLFIHHICHQRHNPRL